MGRKKVTVIVVIMGLTVFNIWLAKYIIRPMKTRMAPENAHEEAMRIGARQKADMQVHTVDDIQTAQHLRKAAQTGGEHKIHAANDQKRQHPVPNLRLNAPVNVLPGDKPPAEDHPPQKGTAMEHHHDFPPQQKLRERQFIQEDNVIPNPQNQQNFPPRNFNQLAPGAGIIDPPPLINNNQIPGNMGLVGDIALTDRVANVPQTLIKELAPQKATLNLESLKTAIERNIRDIDLISQSLFPGDMNVGGTPGVAKYNRYFGDVAPGSPNLQLQLPNIKEEQADPPHDFILNSLQSNFKPPPNAAVLETPRVEEMNKLKTLLNIMKNVNLNNLTAEKIKNVHQSLSQILQKLRSLHQQQEQQRRQQQQHELLQPVALAMPQTQPMVNSAGGESLLNKDVFENMVNNIARDNDVGMNTEEGNMLNNLLKAIDLGKLPLPNNIDPPSPDINNVLPANNNHIVGMETHQERERSL